MSEIDLKNKETVNKQAKAGLENYMSDSKRQPSIFTRIKLETVLTSRDEEVVAVKGWT